jgi:hypothetical protein
MLKLAVLGALGYAGYKYYQKNLSGGHRVDQSYSGPLVAGGPLSDRATIQKDPNIPPPL